MTLRQYFTIMIIGTILCWISWLFVIVNIDPFQASQSAFLFFYLSLFLALVGTISIIAFLIHTYFSNELLPMFKYVQKSFRNACIISSIFILLLYLHVKGLLNVWNFGAFIFIILFFVSFFASARHSRPEINNQITK